MAAAARAGVALLGVAEVEDVRGVDREVSAGDDEAGTIAAGEEAASFEDVTAEGTTVRVYTVPTESGAFRFGRSLAEVERTLGGPEATRVEVLDAVASGRNVREAGSDIEPGEVVISGGTLLGPAHLGVLASVNVRRPVVVRRPRLGVISTGDELVDDDRPLAPGQIRESNRPMLVALARSFGVDAVDLGTVADDRTALTDALERAAATCDAVATSGGVSMGDFDLVKVVLGELADMRWMQVAIRPAKPFAFGMLDGTPIFGLPGNPVSSLVSLALLGVLKWVFTTGVTEVKTDVRELKAMMQQMTKDVAELSKALAVASKDAITRKEFEELRAEVDGIQQRVVHIEEMVKQGVVPP